MAGKKSIEHEITEKALGFRDTNLEYNILSYILCENPTITGIDGNWFSDIILQDIYTIADDLKIPLSKAMVLNELRDRNLMDKTTLNLYEESLDRLYEPPDKPVRINTIKHIMTQLFRLYESRKVLIACGQVIGSLRQFDLDASKSILAKVSKTVVIQDAENSISYLDHYDRRKQIMAEKEAVRDASEDGEAGIRTGLYVFDRMTGGLMPKEFGVVAGVTGVGKTAALIEFGVTAYENGHNVIIGSGEMSVDELAFRVDSRITRIHGMKFRTADLDTEDYKKWDNTIIQYRATRENTLWLCGYPRRFTVEDFERDIFRAEEETGQSMEVCCLDYINIVSPVIKGRSDWKDQSEAVWDFKGLCSEHSLVGWTAGQVIDDAYDKELYDASDMKYARAISEAAPIIVALIQTDKDRIEGRMKFQVIKMRNAVPPKRPIKLIPNLSIMRLHEEIKQSTTLKGMKGSSIDLERKARRKKPVRGK